MARKDKCLRQRFSVRGDFCSPLLGTCGNMWWYFCMGGGGYWHVVSKEMLTNIIQGSGKSLPKKKYSVPPVNSNGVQVMKLWSKVLLKAIRLNSFYHDTLLETCTWKIKEFYLKILPIYVKKIYTVFMRASADFHQCLCCRNCSPRDHGGLLHWQGWGQYSHTSLEANQGKDKLVKATKKEEGAAKSSDMSRGASWYFRFKGAGMSEGEYVSGKAKDPEH